MKIFIYDKNQSWTNGVINKAVASFIPMSVKEWEGNSEMYLVITADDER